jgi:hypothetical protein
MKLVYYLSIIQLEVPPFAMQTFLLWREDPLLGKDNEANTPLRTMINHDVIAELCSSPLHTHTHTHTQTQWFSVFISCILGTDL